MPAPDSMTSSLFVATLPMPVSNTCNQASWDWLMHVLSGSQIGSRSIYRFYIYLAQFKGFKSLQKHEILKTDTSEFDFSNQNKSITNLYPKEISQKVNKTAIDSIHLYPCSRKYGDVVDTLPYITREQCLRLMSIFKKKILRVLSWNYDFKKISDTQNVG